MENEKQQISKWLEVEANNLNEISLGDVRFRSFVQDNISSAVVKLLSLDNPASRPLPLATYQSEAIPCKGFWVEDTKELVVYLKISNQLKAIVVPPEGWVVREDITLN